MKKIKYLTFLTLFISFSANAKCILQDATYDSVTQNFTSTATCQSTGVAYTKSTKVGAIEAKHLAATDCTSVCRTGSIPTFTFNGLPGSLGEQKTFLIEPTLGSLKDVDNDITEVYFEMQGTKLPRDVALSKNSNMTDKSPFQFIKSEILSVSTSVTVEKIYGFTGVVDDSQNTTNGTSRNILVSMYAFDSNGNSRKVSSLINPISPSNLRPRSKLFIQEEGKARVEVSDGSILNIVRNINDGQKIQIIAEPFDLDGTIQKIRWFNPIAEVTNPFTFTPSNNYVQEVVLPQVPANSVKTEKIKIGIQPQDNEYVSDGLSPNAYQYYYIDLNLVRFNDPLIPVLKINNQLISCTTDELKTNYTCSPFNIKERNNVQFDLSESYDKEGNPISFQASITGGINNENYSFSGNTISQSNALHSYYLTDRELATGQKDTISVNFSLLDDEGKEVFLTIPINIENDNFLPEIFSDPNVTLFEEEEIYFPITITDKEDDISNPNNFIVSLSHNNEIAITYSYDVASKSIIIKAPKRKIFEGNGQSILTVFVQDSNGGVTSKPIGVTIVPKNLKPIIEGYFLPQDRYFTDTDYVLDLNGTIDPDSSIPPSLDLSTTNLSLFESISIIGDKVHFKVKPFIENSKNINIKIKATDDDLEFTEKDFSLIVYKKDLIKITNSSCSPECNSGVINHIEGDAQILINNIVKDFSISNDPQGVLQFGTFTPEYADFEYVVLQNSGKYFDIIIDNFSNLKIYNINESKENHSALIKVKAKNLLTGYFDEKEFTINFLTKNINPSIDSVIIENDEGLPQPFYKNEKINITLNVSDIDGNVDLISLTQISGPSVNLIKTSNNTYSFINSYLAGDIILEATIIDDEGGITKEIITIASNGEENIYIESIGSLNITSFENENSKSIPFIFKDKNGLLINEQLITFNTELIYSNADSLTDIFLETTSNYVLANSSNLPLDYKRKTSEGDIKIQKKMTFIDNRGRTGEQLVTYTYKPLNTKPVSVLYAAEENTFDNIYYPNDSILIDTIESYDPDGEIISEKVYILNNGSWVEAELLEPNLYRYKIPSDFKDTMLQIKTVITDDDLEEEITNFSFDVIQEENFIIEILGADSISEKDSASYSVNFKDKNGNNINERLISSTDISIIGSYGTLSKEGNNFTITALEPKESIGSQILTVQYTMIDSRGIENYTEKNITIVPINSKPQINYIQITNPNPELAVGDVFEVYVDAYDEEGIVNYELLSSGFNSQITKTDYNKFLVKILDKSSDYKIIAKITDSDFIFATSSIDLNIVDKPIINIELNDIITDENTEVNIIALFKDQNNQDAINQIKEIVWDFDDNTLYTNFEYFNSLNINTPFDVLVKDGNLIKNITIKAKTIRDDYIEKTITLTVKPVNSEPAINGSLITADPFANNPITIAVQADDSDGVIESVYLKDANGTVLESHTVNANSGNKDFITVLPARDASQGYGSQTYIYGAVDNDGVATEQNLVVTYKPLANPVVDFVYDNPVNEETSISIIANVTDFEGVVIPQDQIKSFSWTITNGGNYTVEGQDLNTLSIKTPTVLVKDGDKKVSVEYTVTDIRNMTTTKTFELTVKPVNSEPAINGSLITADPFANNPITIAVQADDSDGVIESVYLKDANGTVLESHTVNANSGNKDFITVLPARDASQGYGSQTYVFGAVDNDGVATEQNLVVTYKPLANPVVDFVYDNPVNEETSISIIANVTDFEGVVIPQDQIKSFSWTITNGGNYTVEGQDLNTLSIRTPTVLENDDIKYLEVNYIVTDIRNMETKKSIKLDINPINEKPVIVLKSDSLDNLISRDKILIDLRDSYDLDGSVVNYELTSTLISDIVQISKGLFEVALPLYIKENEEKINTQLKAIIKDNEDSVEIKNIDISFDGLEKLKIELISDESVVENSISSIKSIIKNQKGETVESVYSYEWKIKSGIAAEELSSSLNEIIFKSPEVKANEVNKFIEYELVLIDLNGIESKESIIIELDYINTLPYVLTNDIGFEKLNGIDYVYIDVEEKDEDGFITDSSITNFDYIKNENKYFIKLEDFVGNQQSVNFFIKDNEDEGNEIIVNFNLNIQDEVLLENTSYEINQSDVVNVNGISVENIFSKNFYSTNNITLEDIRASELIIDIKTGSLNINETGKIFSKTVYNNNAYYLNVFNLKWNEIHPVAIENFENKEYFEKEVIVIDTSSSYDTDGYIVESNIVSENGIVINKVSEHLFEATLPERLIQDGLGVANFSLTVKDNDGLLTTKDFSIEFSPKNNAPYSNISDTFIFDYEDNAIIQPKAFDDDGYVSMVNWEHVSGYNIDYKILNEETLTFTTPKLVNNEETVMKLTVQDNEGYIFEKEITIKYKYTNKPPKIEGIYGSKSIFAGNNQVYTVKASDYKGLIQSIVFSSNSLNFTKISDDSIEVLTNLNEVGKTESIIVTVIDQEGAETTQEFTVSIIKSEQKIIQLEKINILPVNYATKNALGQVTSRIQSETIKDSNGQMISGEQEIFINLDENATSSVFFGVNLVHPNSEVSAIYDFTYTDGKLDMIVFPEEKNKIEVFDYTIYLKKINKNISLINKNGYFELSDGFKPNNCLDYKFRNDDYINYIKSPSNGLYLTQNGVVECKFTIGEALEVN